MATFDGAPLQRIGDGPVATVYLGQRSGVPVALKVFPKKLDKRTMAAFTKEQAKLSAVRRISSILLADGVDELGTGEFAIRMEPCAQSLAALVDRTGALPPADVVVLGRAVAEALAAAHGCGVVHGGISPHNILFRTSGEPVLADFGVTLRQAFARDPLHAIEFLPPETLRTGALDEKTDLYGLGAVLHYALAGRSPHPGRLGEQPGERVLRILGEPVPALNDSAVPIGLSTLVARLLSADPARRLGDARVVADQLGAMVPDAPRRPVADDFDDFSAPRQVSPPPRAQARAVSPPPHVPAVPAFDDGDDFDDFLVPGHGVGSPPPVPRPAVPPPVAAPVALPGSRTWNPPPPPVPAPPPPPPVGSPSAAEHPATGRAGSDDAGDDAGDGAHWAPHSDPAPRKPDGPAEPVVQDEGPVQHGAQHVTPAAEPAMLPLAPLTPVHDVAPTEGLPTPATVEFRVQARRPAGDFDDDFPAPLRGRAQAKVLAGPLAPPGEGPRKLIRYDLLAGGAILLALLALVPLLLFRGESEEPSSVPQVPPVAGAGKGDVEIVLEEPVDLTDSVRLSWTADEELDFVVVMAPEGKETEFKFPERKLSMTLPVDLDRKYCFQVQATDGNDTYESNVVSLRDATCKE